MKLTEIEWDMERPLGKFSCWEDAAEFEVNYLDMISVDREYSPRAMQAIALTLATKVRSESDTSGLYGLIKLAGHHAACTLKWNGQWDPEDMHDIFVAKQKDYGHGNILSFGVVGVAVRLADKIARIWNLTERGAQPENESLKDSWIDIVGYSCIACMLEAGSFRMELREVA